MENPKSSNGTRPLRRARRRDSRWMSQAALSLGRTGFTNPTVLIDCSTSEGMFDTEVAVAIDTVDGPVSLFADKGLVENAGQGHRLRAYTGEVQAEATRVLLPTEAFETGSRWILVLNNRIHG